MNIQRHTAIAAFAIVSLLQARAANNPNNLNPHYAGQLLGDAGPPSEPLSLWYRQPAAQWVEALAIGNGRLGAMVFGGIERERLQLNEDTLWAAGPYDPSNTNALAALPEARRLVFAGRYQEAEKLIQANMMARPLREMPYQPVGDLLLDFPETQQVENYRRDLNLDRAVATTRYTAGGVTFTREVFASPVDQAIVMRIRSDHPGEVSFRCAFRSPQSNTVSLADHTLLMKGVNPAQHGIPGALKFAAAGRVILEGGKLTEASDSLSVTGADSATLLIAAATSYRNYHDVSGNPEETVLRQLRAAGKKSFTPAAHGACCRAPAPLPPRAI